MCFTPYRSSVVFEPSSPREVLRYVPLIAGAGHSIGVHRVPVAPGADWAGRRRAVTTDFAAASELRVQRAFAFRALSWAFGFHSSTSRLSPRVLEDSPIITSMIPTR